MDGLAIIFIWCCERYKAKRLNDTNVPKRARWIVLGWACPDIQNVSGRSTRLRLTKDSEYLLDLRVSDCTVIALQLSRKDMRRVTRRERNFEKMREQTTNDSFRGSFQAAIVDLERTSLTEIDTARRMY